MTITQREQKRRMKQSDIILAAALMLEYLGEDDLHQRLMKIADEVKDGTRVPVFPTLG